MDANMKQDFSTMHHAKQSGFLDYLCDWKKQHEEEYFSFRKGFEQIDGGDNSVYTRLFEMAKSCIPPYFFTMLMNVFGIEDTESEISEEEKALIDGIVDELYEFDGFVKLGVVDGEFEVDLVKEKGESDNPNVAYVRIKGIDEWWQSVPVQYRMVASLMFSGVAEKELKLCARRVFIAAYAYSPFVIDKMCDLAYEEKDPLLLSGLYYIMLEHGFRNMAKQLGGILSLPNMMGLFMPSLVSNTIGKMAQTSIANGFDKKADWKADFKKNENKDLRREVMATIEETAGKHGRPHLQQERHDIDDHLIGDKSAVKQEISNILANMEHDYELAFLKEALIQSNHLDDDISFSKFHHAICTFAEKDYKYDRAQRMDTTINFRSQEFETSKKPRLMRGRRLVRIWTKRLLQIQ